MTEFKTNKDGSITINPKDWDFVYLPENRDYSVNFFKSHDGTRICEKREESGYKYYYAPRYVKGGYIGGGSFKLSPMLNGCDKPFEIYPNYC